MLPLVGAMKSRSYEKEELVELWDRLAEEYDLPLLGSEGAAPPHSLRKSGTEVSHLLPVYPGC